MLQIYRRITVSVLVLLAALFIFVAPQATLAAPASQTTSGDPVILAAGDIAKCNRDQDSMTAYLLGSTTGPILAIGDTAYESGSPQEFADCWAPTWGQQDGRIYPVPGNHEYLTGGAAGYFGYFGDRATPLEPGCRKECNGYYSFDVGAWHIVALNSELPGDRIAEQTRWLRDDLAAHPSVCTLAFWHKPRYSSGYHNGGSGQEFFQALYDYGADIVLSGHDHDYERFAPQDNSAQYAPDRGIRQFVVGTGGDALRDYKFIQPNSEVRNSETWGVIKLTLHPTSYDWEFLPISGQTWTDSGTANCVTAPGVPTTRTSAEATDNTATVDLVANTADNGTASTSTTAAAPASIATGGVNYTIKAGDTLGTIGAAYGLGWEVLAAANGLDAYSVLEIGQVIRIPGAQTAAITPATTTSTAPATASTTVSSTVATPAAASTLASTTAATGPGTSYTVKEGDTLLGIALSYNVEVDAIVAASGLADSNLIQVGQVLTIPAKASSAGSTLASPTAVPTGTLKLTTGQGSLSLTLPTPTPTGAITTTTASTRTLAAPTAGTVQSTPAPTSPATGGDTYTVVSGDTIFSIAVAHGLNWQELLKLNGMTEQSLLQIGQTIRLK